MKNVGGPRTTCSTATDPLTTSGLPGGLEGRHHRLRDGVLERRARLAGRRPTSTSWTPRSRRPAAGLHRRVRRRRGPDRPGTRRPALGGHRPDLRAGAAAAHVRLARRRRCSRWSRRSSASAPAWRSSAWLAAALTCPTTAPTVATLLGLGVAVDYGLFLVARHREQLDHGLAPDRSVGRATAHLGGRDRGRRQHGGGRDPGPLRRRRCPSSARSGWPRPSSSR